MMNKQMQTQIQTSVERLVTLSDDDMDALCEAANQAIIDGNGFGWLTPPKRDVLEAFWRGVILVPERELFVARLDGRIVGSAQLVKPPRNNEAGAHRARLMSFFVAPWARGLGLAVGLLDLVEKAARTQEFEQIEADIRETQSAAIKLCEQAGYRRWAVQDRYAKVNSAYVRGFFYTKNLTNAPKSIKKAKRQNAEPAR